MLPEQWRLEKLFPRTLIREWVFLDSGGRSAEQIVDDAIRWEAEHAHEPAPPYITHEGLVDNIGYLLHQRLGVGSAEHEILAQLDCDFPHAQIEQMIWRTHYRATAEEIVAEIYRREAAAKEGAGGTEGK